MGPLPPPPELPDEVPTEMDLGDDIEFADDGALVPILDDDAFDDFGADQEELQALMKDHDPNDESESAFA